MNGTQFRSLILLTGLLATAGCSTHSGSGHGALAPSGHVRELQGLPDRVSTLMVDPMRIGRISVPGQPSVQVSIGAFYARFDAPDGVVDELALMVQLHGAAAESLVETSRELLLDIDGMLYTGTPGSSENSFRVDRSETDSRAMMAIPISPDVLLQLAQAKQVRGRVGLWGSFAFPDSFRSRFAALVQRLPPGAPSATGRAIAGTRVTVED
jgi:hypothetical protein